MFHKHTRALSAGLSACAVAALAWWWQGDAGQPPVAPAAARSAATAAPPSSLFTSADADRPSAATVAISARPSLPGPTPAGAPPPGVSVAQWQALQAEMAGRADGAAELQRLRDYFGFSAALQRFRALRGSPGGANVDSSHSAELITLARTLDNGLAERWQRNEVSAAEAQHIKAALLELLVADAASRPVQLAAWTATLRAAPDADQVARTARDTAFQRQQAAVLAAWSARPAPQRDPAQLERELDALRRQSFEPATPR